MDRNTISGLILIFVIFIGFSLYNTNKVTKSYEKTMVTADSLYREGKLTEARDMYLKAVKYKPGLPEAKSKVAELNIRLSPNQTSSTPADTIAKTADNQLAPVVTPAVTDPAVYGAFQAGATGETNLIRVENEKFIIHFSRKGGRVYSVELKDYKTHDQKPLILFDGDSTTFGFKFFTADNRLIETTNLFFELVGDDEDILVKDESAEIAFRLGAGEGKYIEYVYTVFPDKYMVDMDIRFVDLRGVIASNLNSLSFDWKMYIPQQEKGKQNEDTYTNIKYKYYQAEVDGFRDRSSKEFEKADIPTKLRWVAFKDQFFSSVLIADDHFVSGSVSTTKLPASEKYLRFFTSEVGVPYNPENDNGLKFKLYYGPNHFTTLKKYDLDLEQLVFLGKNIIRWINQFVIIPIFNWLDNSITNYGIIILILTLIIKIVLFPLTFKSYLSQAKMKILKPMVDEIGKKFPKKEDAMKKQQATMDLYKKGGVNPLGGCLPMFLQFPILFAMFRFFPASIELRQEAFLWATDLSTYDSIFTLPFTIPMYGNHVSLFTLLMTVSTILTMKFNSPASTGQEQIPGMKSMMYIMPVMFMFILNNFSSGLTYYYFLANMITFGQNWISNRFIDDDAILRKIEENKKKPVVKSKWQQRIEDMAKQKGIKPAKR